MIRICHDSSPVGCHVCFEASAQVVNTTSSVEMKGGRRREKLGFAEARNGLGESGHI
jgi:hypothetical protein